MPRKSNEKRNKELVLKRKKNPLEWSWRKLAEHYRFKNHTTARGIYMRDRNKY